MNHGTSDTASPALGESRYRWLDHAWVPVVLALVMAAPSVRGGFLSGDDIQLVRDHVLVNHPSLPHLRELFSIPHRDLYQPVPLATFAFNFLVIRRLGLTPTAAGPEAGAWVFHLTNVLIHALNAWLVWRLVRKVTEREAIALVAASLFAVHPLNVECVAWLNGRMTMLSATFTLGALLAAQRALDRPGVAPILLAVLMAALAMMSKINVALPVLLLLLPFVRRQRPGGRWWIMFTAVTVLTGFFAALNAWLSRGQLVAAEEVLEGSRWVRTILSLGWYVSRYFVPSGLAPWHPTEKLITWAHPQFLSATLTVAVFLVVTALLLRYSRFGVAGVIWFLATVAVTLPLVPSRNLMVAERYVYLPAIGFHWIVAAGWVYALTALRLRQSAGEPLPYGRGSETEGRGQTPIGWLVAVGVAVLATLIGVAWKTTGYYRDDVARCVRSAELYPEHAGVWTRLAWAYYDAREYEQAVQAADVELQHHPVQARGDAWQVQGMARLRSGSVADALAKLAAAVDLDPADGMAQVRLATALAESGRLDDAIPHYRRAVELMPGYNPGIIGLAQTYRKLDRPMEAAVMFEKALVNNPFDPVAATALAEIELNGGQVPAAAARLEKLLSWMPENAVARANLGLCYLRLGRTDEAVRAYRAALAYDPTLVPPRLNLATLLAQRGMAEEAAVHFRTAVEQSGYADSAILLPYSDFLVAQGDLRGAAAVWQKGLVRRPDDATMVAWYGWICVLAEQWEPARQVRARLSEAGGEPVAALLAGIMLDVQENQPEAAAAATARLCADASGDAREARDRLRQALQAYSSRHAENPWPYYLMILLLKADSRTDEARRALDAFERVCTDEGWRQRARLLLAGRSEGD